MKKTPWYPPHIKPVRVGVYECFSEGGYKYWNGRRWGIFSGSPKAAYQNRRFDSAIQKNDWRGLAKEPK